MAVGVDVRFEFYLQFLEEVVSKKTLLLLIFLDATKAHASQWNGKVLKRYVTGVRFFRKALDGSWRVKNLWYFKAGHYS